MTIYVDWDVTSQTKQTEQNCMTELPTCRSANACLPACLNQSLTHKPTHPPIQPATHSGWLAAARLYQTSTHSQTNSPSTHAPTSNLTHPTTHSPIHSLTRCIYHSLTHSLTRITHSQVKSIQNFILDPKPGYENKVTLERERM